MGYLIQNIKQLVGILPQGKTILRGKEMSRLETIENAFLVVKNGLIYDFGSMAEVPIPEKLEVIDTAGKLVFPSWCDSHTHLVFAGTRENEFVDRINGLSYEEIATRGGGILNSANKLAETSEEELYQSASKRLEEVIWMGTGAIEMKSGYGLSAEAELKILRVIKRLKENYPVELKSTFLGAHAIPKIYKENRKQYLDLLIHEIIPKVAEEQLADYIDIFCETNYFQVDEMHRMLEAGIQYGLKPKVHVNQFTSIGGVQKAVEFGAISVDHLEVMKEKDFKSLENSSTIPTVLPSCSFFINIPYAPAKQLIERNLPLALASDYNPGSTPSGNMNFVVALACIQQKLTPEQAINAATINGAAAMELNDNVGSITKGKKANLFITKPSSSYNFLPYGFGERHVEQVMLNGKLFQNKLL